MRRARFPGTSGPPGERATYHTRATTRVRLHGDRRLGDAPHGPTTSRVKDPGIIGDRRRGPDEAVGIGAPAKRAPTR